MRVYFHVDELSRDSIVASNLRRELERRGHQLVIGNRLATSILKKYGKLFPNVIDALILPRLLFFKGMEYLPSMKVILPTECIGMSCDIKNPDLMTFVLLGKECLEGDLRAINTVDLILTWGRIQKRFIQENYPTIKPSVALVGHPRFDNNQQSTAKTRNISSKKIGLVTRQCLLNDFAGRRPLDAIVDHAHNNKCLGVSASSGEELRDFDFCFPERMYVEAREIEIYIAILKELSDDGFEFIVRVHPREDRTLWEDIIRREGINAELSPWKEPFSYFLQKVGHVITPASTSIFDSINARVVPILISRIDPLFSRLTHPTSEENHPIMQHIYQPNSIQEIKNFIKSGKYDHYRKPWNAPEVLQIMAEETGFPEARNAISNIVDAIEEKYKNDSQRKKVGNITLAKQYILYELISRIVTLAFQVRRLGGKEQSSTFVMGLKNKRFIKNI